MSNWITDAIARYNEFPNGIGPISQAEIDATAAKAAKEGRVHRWWVNFDIGINGVLLNGIAGETISSHTGRAALNGAKWAIFLAKFLNLFERNHVAYAMAADKGRGLTVIAIEEQWLQKDSDGNIR